MGFFGSALFEKLNKKYDIGMMAIASFLVLSSGGNILMLFTGLCCFGLSQLSKVKGSMRE
jgi:hypothetical protein